MENKENFVPPRSINNPVEKIVTHEGMFHADDVFATAILKDLFPEYMKIGVSERVDYVKYIRSRAPSILQEGIESKTTMLVDVGGQNNFDKYNLDHHQFKGAGRRENGIEYAAAGLVWKHFGKEWIDYVENYTRLARFDSEEEEAKEAEENNKQEKKPQDAKSMIERNTGIERNEEVKLSEGEKDLIWKQMDKNYVEFFDANDTGQLNDVTCSFTNGKHSGGFQFTLPEIVRLANVDCHDGRNQYKRFKDTVEMFRNVTFSMVNKYIDIVKGMREFDSSKCEMPDDKKTLIIKKVLQPAVNSFVVNNNPEYKGVEYYATLNSKNEYTINVAPVEEGMREYRNSNAIPKELRLGNRGKDISKIIGIDSGVTFVHTAGFLANCNNEESAKKFLEYCASRSKKS